MGVDVPVVLVGNAAYLLLPWLIKPYHESGASPAQTVFNSRLSRARMTVERAFGRLKGRWRCLMTRYDCHLGNINNTVAACCVLHNFCEGNSEEYDQHFDADCDNEVAEINNPQANTSANTTRDALCSYFSSFPYVSFYQGRKVNSI